MLLIGFLCPLLCITKNGTPAMMSKKVEVICLNDFITCGMKSSRLWNQNLCQNLMMKTDSHIGIFSRSSLNEFKMSSR